MQSKIVHAYNENFSYKEDVEIFANEEGEFEIPDNCTEVPLPIPNWKPIFDTEKNRWIETITQEELDAIQQLHPPQTDIELLGQQITDLEIESMIQGQQMTDFEIRLLELEARNHV